MCMTLREKTLCRTFLQMISQTQPARRHNSTKQSSLSGHNPAHSQALFTLTLKFSWCRWFIDRAQLIFFFPPTVMQRRSWGWLCVLQTQWLCLSWLLQLLEMGCLITWILKVKVLEHPIVNLSGFISFDFYFTKLNMLPCWICMNISTEYLKKTNKRIMRWNSFKICLTRN